MATIQITLLKQQPNKVDALLDNELECPQQTDFAAGMRSNNHCIGVSRQIQCFCDRRNTTLEELPPYYIISRSGVTPK